MNSIKSETEMPSYSSLLQKILAFFEKVDIENYIIRAEVDCDTTLFEHTFYNLINENIAESIAEYLMKYFKNDSYDDKKYNFNVDTKEFKYGDFDFDTTENYDVETIEIILKKTNEEDEEDEEVECCLIYKKGKCVTLTENTMCAWGP